MFWGVHVAYLYVHVSSLSFLVGAHVAYLLYAKSMCSFLGGVLRVYTHPIFCLYMRV